MELKLEFLEQMRELLGSDYEAFLESMKRDAIPSVRLNRRKSRETMFDSAEEMANSVGLCGDGAKRVGWCKSGIFLPNREIYTLLPKLHCGAFYVQDSSSMLHELICEKLIDRGLIPEEAIVLDACSAPGGKTTAIINSLGDDAVVVANEYDSKRCGILMENLQKWGFENVIVTQGETSNYKSIRNLFDMVVVDAPCSGEGMMRKEPVACHQWSKSLVRQCSILQKEILDNVMGSLIENGVLIYSTCTFNREENEDIIEWLIRERGFTPIDMDLKEECGESVIYGENHTYRFMPHKSPGEGQFIAVLQKRENSDEDFKIENDYHSRKNKKSRSTKCSGFDKKMIEQIGSVIGNGVIAGKELNLRNNSVEVISRKVGMILNRIKENVKVVSAGVEVAYLKGMVLIPAIGLALSGLIDKSSIPVVEIEKDSALKYLRSEMIVLPEDSPKGYVAVSYQGSVLGFVKNLGTRANNLYPSNWRIRMKE